MPITPKNAPTAAQPSTELLLKIDPTAGSSRSPACTQIATSRAIITTYTAGPAKLRNFSIHEMPFRNSTT